MRPPRTPPPGPEMACRICRTPLNTYTGPGGHTAHLHPVRPGGYDHDPRPAPASDVETVARCCDFCGGTDLLAEFSTTPVRALAAGPDVDTVHDFGTTWSACAPCARLVEDGRLEPLWRHAMARIGWPPNDVAAQATRQVHAAVLAGLQPRRTLITTTAWPHTGIPATALPKVRDRAVAMLIGPYLLPDPFTSPVRQQLAAGLNEGQLFWIDPEFTALADTAATGLPPATLTDSDLPVPHGLLVWATPVGPDKLAAASWTATADGNWQVTVYRTVGSPDLDPPTTQYVREHLGWLLPVEHTTLTTGTPVTAGNPYAPLAATWLLITQHIAETAPVPLSRATHRTYTRTGRTAPEVRLVRIRPRPATPTGRPHPTGGQRQRPEPESRVWVSGFWRQQAHGPGRALRKTIYVHPYLRGPAEAPIDPTTTVRVLGALRPRRSPQTTSYQRSDKPIASY